jgi:hypothetical protein
MKLQWISAARTVFIYTMLNLHAIRRSGYTGQRRPTAAAVIKCLKKLKVSVTNRCAGINKREVTARQASNPGRGQCSSRMHGGVMAYE